MFTVEVKTNRPWNVNNLDLSEKTWTDVCKKKFAKLKEAEIELSYLQQSFQQIDNVNDLEVNYRILNQKQEVLFEKKHLF